MKKVMFAVIIGMIAVLSIPIAFYVWNFINEPVSKNPVDWGLMGDYLGGVLNPIIGLINIIVLVYITYLVSDNDSKKLINEFRHASYIELTKELDVKKEHLDEKSLAELDAYLSAYCFNNLFLFQGELNEPFQKIMGSLSYSVSSMKMYHELYFTDTIDNNGDIIKTFVNVSLRAEGKKLFDREWDKFKIQRQTLLGFIQRIMINGDIKPYLKYIDAEAFLQGVERKSAERKNAEKSESQ